MGKRNIGLHGQMQSGKTGVLIHIYRSLKKGYKYYYVTGEQRIGFGDKFKADLKGLNITILMRQELQKYNNSSAKQLKKLQQKVSCLK